MQVINNTYISNAQGIYFPEFYSSFAGMINEDMIKCQCQDFEQSFVFTDVIYLQVNTTGIPRIEVNGDVYNSISSSNGNHNFAIPLTSYGGMLISLNLIVPPVSGASINTFSTPFFVKPIDDGCTVLLEWRSECESMGIDYTLDPDFFSSLRVPHRFIRPASSDLVSMNTTKNSFGRWEFCSSDLDEQWTFAVSEMPHWMHQVVRKAMNNSYFAINGTEFFSRTGFRFTERRCCFFQGEATLIPKDSDWAINNCCINDFTGFVQKPQAQIDCNTPATAPNVAIDTRGSTDSDNVIITSSTNGVSYIYNFGGYYFVEIDAVSDPSLPGSWTYIGGSGTQAEFLTNIVGNISIPANGFSGYFDLDCAGITALGEENMSISVTINDNGVASSSANCTISCMTADNDCPVPSLTSSNVGDLTNIIISNLGSTNNSADPIHNDPDYTFTHTFGPGPCGTIGIAYFTVSGAGGTNTLAFSNWHPSIDAAGQSAVSALFTGGMDATGYSFSKEDVILAMIDNGFTGGGGEWCLRSDVLHTPGGCSDSTTIDIGTQMVLHEYVHQSQGFAPLTQATTDVGLAGYFNETGQYNFTNINTQITASLFWIEGNATLFTTDANANALDSNGNIRDSYNFTNDGRVFHSAAYAGNSGLTSYNSAYFDWTAGLNSFLRIRFLVSPPLAFFAGNVVVRNFLEPGGNGVLSTETLQSVNFTVLRYPVGGGGINVSGNDDPSGGTATPHEISLLAGGIAYPFTALSGLEVRVDSPIQGTYYVLTDAVSSSGYPLQNVTSFTVIDI